MEILQTERELYDKLKLAGLNPSIDDVHALFQIQRPDLSAHAQLERLTKIEEKVEIFERGDIINGGFEDQWLGWYHTVNWSLDSTIYFQGLTSAKCYTILVDRLEQTFSPPLDLTSMRLLSCATRVDSLDFADFFAFLTYDDGTRSPNSGLLPSAIDAWEIKEIALDQTKKLQKLSVWAAKGIDRHNAWVDAVKVWR